MANTTINILDIPQSGSVNEFYGFLAVDRNQSKAWVADIDYLKTYVESTALETAIYAYNQANTVSSNNEITYNVANTANIIAINAYNQANMAFEAANVSAGGTAFRALAVAQTAYGQANIAFIKANTVNNLANIAYIQANLAYAAANTNSGVDAYNQANMAYAMANTANTNARNASNLDTGIISPDLLGGGVASSSTFLRGDQEWVTLNYQTANATLTAWASKAVPTGLVVGNTDEQTISNKRILKCIEQKATPVISGGSLTLDLNLGNAFIVALNQNITSITITPYTPSSNTSSDFLTSFLIALTADGTARTINWGSIKWADGIAPTLTSTVGKVDVFTFLNFGNSTYYGFVSGQNL